MVLDRQPAGGKRDRIADPATGEDRIRLDDAIFAAAVERRTLPQDAFLPRATVTPAAPRIVFDPETARLFHGADGNGCGGRVQSAADADAKRSGRRRFHDRLIATVTVRLRQRGGGSAPRACGPPPGIFGDKKWGHLACGDPGGQPAGLAALPDRPRRRNPFPALRPGPVPRWPPLPPCRSSRSDRPRRVP